MLTISGTGFGPEVTVTVDSSECELIFTNYSTIICITPAKVTKIPKYHSLVTEAVI